MDITYHYPPELMNLLIQAIPTLCNSKMDTLMFFRGAGVPESMQQDLALRVAQDRRTIGKHEIARTVLERLNQKGEATLRQRRELLKRIVEFESFSTLYPNNQHVARGLVAEIQKVVNVKDAFTRMERERERERATHIAEQEARAAEINRRRETFNSIKRDLYGLFAMQNPWQRGKALEGVLNRLFQAAGILVRESFTLRGDESQGIIEQIDGVIILDGHLYLVEMKWHREPLGPPQISEHLVRLFGRDGARGLFISNTGYTAGAIEQCKVALVNRAVALITLEEIVYVLEQELDLSDVIREKATQAIVSRIPFYQIGGLTSGSSTIETSSRR